MLFLKNNFTKKDFENNKHLLQQFAKLDDHDIYTCLKQWMNHEDIVLSKLSNMIINRKLLKVKIQRNPFSQKEIMDKKTAVMKKLNLRKNLTDYFVFSGKISNKTYSYEKAKINILLKDGGIKELKDASDQTLNQMLSKRVNKFSLCYLNIK